MKNSTTPPRWADRLLEWVCADHRLEEIQGDLHERFQKRVKEWGVQQARRQYAWEALGFLRPFALKPDPQVDTSSNHSAMFHNYLTIALRILRRNKVFSFINVFGLAMGVAFCLFIFLFTQDELSFDRFHTNADRIYRVHKTNLLEATYQPGHLGGKGFLNSLSQQQANKMIYLPLPLGPLLQEDIPEIEAVVRYREGGSVISNGKQAFREDIRYVDPTFFQVFSFRLKQGEAAQVLADPGSVVISEQIAKKYFGNENPIGKTLIRQQDGIRSFTVTGVAEEAPANSSLTFDILLPFENEPYYAMFGNELYNYFSTFTFVQLKPYASLSAFQKKLDRFVEQRLSKYDADARKDKNVAASVTVSSLGITRLRDTHFDTSVYWPRGSNPVYAYVLSGIGILILLIACLNYVSLALTNAAARSQEIGMRKVMGARRWQLALQLWIEAQGLVLLAVGMALLLVSWFLPVFNYFTDKQLTLQLAHQPDLWWVLLAIAVLVGLLAGSYPAWYLSQFHPVNVLKGNRTYRVNPWLSRTLVLVQYSICLFLITSSVVMYRQIRFVAHKHLGFDQEQVLVLSNFAPEGEETHRLWERMQQYAATHPEVASVTGSNGSFGRGNAKYFYKINWEDTWVDVYGGDEHYLPTLDIALLKGRNFSPRIRSDTNAVLINETLAAKLGDSLEVGQLCKPLNQIVIGIVKDHHFASLENKITPMLIRMRPETTSAFLIKLRKGGIPASIQALQQEWQRIANGQPFDYSFLDEDVAEQYQAYRKWMGIIGWATGFAVLIACMGLFGLSGLSAVNRTKEIGIRKVLGATVGQLFLLLNKDTVRLAAISFALAIPFAWWVMSRWLEDFAYRISLSWSLFAIAGLIGLATALLAVSFYSLKAALANPVKSLRTE